VRRLTVQYRGMDQPGSPIRCKGRIVKKYTEGLDHLVECEIWLENSKGEKTTLGSATVALPAHKP
jgi:hypothetical protein